MTVNPNTPKTTDRPTNRRRFKRSLTAVAVAGALLVPAAGVTIAAAPWADKPAVAAGAYGKGHENGKGKMTADEAEAELRECLEGTDLSKAKDMELVALIKAVRCLELVDGINDDSPLTEKEVRQLVMQGLKGVEAAGVDRVQIPGVLSVLSDSGLLKPLAGERVHDLVTLMAESKVIEDYANGELNRNQASRQIAEVVVAAAEVSAKK